MKHLRFNYTQRFNFWIVIEKLSHESAGVFTESLTHNSNNDFTLSIGERS